MVYEDIKEFRADTGISQKTLGDALGVSPTMVQYIENGMSEMSDELKMRFAKKYGAFYKVKGVNDVTTQVEGSLFQMVSEEPEDTKVYIVGLLDGDIKVFLDKRLAQVFLWDNYNKVKFTAESVVDHV